MGQDDPPEKGMSTHSSILENPMDRGAWQAIVHRVTQSQTRLKRLSMHTRMHARLSKMRAQPQRPHNRKPEMESLLFGTAFFKFQMG